MMHGQKNTKKEKK